MRERLPRPVFLLTALPTHDSVKAYGYKTEVHIDE